MMGNGANEEIQFTRGDSERMVRIEEEQTVTTAEIVKLTSKFNKFTGDHLKVCGEIQKSCNTNTRFRVTIVKVLTWLATGSIGTVIAAGIAQALGILK